MSDITPAEQKDRFWAKVDQGGLIPAHRPDLGPCWLWMGALTSKSPPRQYGIFAANSRKYGAHRWAWEQEHGAVPRGLELDHLCRVTRCVRPSHLEAVTHSENVRRGTSGDLLGQFASAKQWSKTHCPKGHPYNEANTFVHRPPNRKPYRECIACRRPWRVREAALREAR